MWILTYVGALFNGLTLLILGKSFPSSTGTNGVFLWLHLLVA